MERETDVLIVGAGAIGICSAYYLAGRGLSVVVVDKGEVVSGCSYGNAGLVIPSERIPLAAPGMVSKGLKWMLDPASPFYIKPRLSAEMLSWLWKFRGFCSKRHALDAMPLLRDLSETSSVLFDEMAALDGVDFGYRKEGLLFLFSTQDGLRHAIEEARFLEENGVELRTLDIQELQELAPDLRINAAGGVFQVRDSHLRPDQLVTELARLVEQKGVEIHTETEVLGLEAAGGRIAGVRTTRGAISAREVVLAGGAWSPGIAQGLRLRLPIEAAKGYSITFKRPSPCLELPVILSEAKVAVTPLGDTLRFAGTLELAGLDLSVNERRVRAILDAVPRYLPDLDPRGLELIEIWRGLRPCTPDGLPIIGRPKNCGNLIIAAGHAMLGISLAPITGKLVAQLIAGEKPDLDLTGLGVGRFE